MKQIHHVCQLITDGEGHLAIRPFWNGTFYLQSDAQKRLQKGVEDLIETFIIHQIEPIPLDAFGKPFAGQTVGSGQIISAERLHFVGYKTEYKNVYVIVRFEVK